LITARYFSSDSSDSGSLRTPCPPPACAAGRQGITPAFGYSAPHPSAEGTLTLLTHALPSTHYGGVRLLVSVRHRLRLLAFPMRTATLGTNTRPRRPDTRSPSFRCDPFARDVALDPGRASAPRNDGAAHVAFERMKTLGPCDIDLSRLNPTPHAIAVYASSPLSPAVTQHSLPSGRYPLLGPDFHRLDRTSLRLAHSFDDLVGAGE
jgi:hypothetical protein